jgi:hypothetical protein
MVATTIRDEHVLPTFDLEPAETPTVAEVVERAAGLRGRALFEEP